MARILVVDDDQYNRIVTGDLLSHQGHEIIRAGNGAEALALALREQPDLIVTDVLMPIMDGFTLCREWMRDERLRRVPFLFYTATYTDAADRALGLDLGARNFLIKGPDSSRLLQAVDEILCGEDVADPPEPEVDKGQETILQEYNAALVRKLESKMLQLMEANRALEQESEKRKRAEMAARKALAELHQADKMSTVGTLAAGIAHEINNPVAFILPNLQQLREEMALVMRFFQRLDEGAGSELLHRDYRRLKLKERLAELPQLLEDCVEGMIRIRDTSRELKQFARMDGELYESVQLEDVLESSLTIARNLIKHRARLRRDYQPVPDLVVDKGKLGQVLLNILVNAAQAIGDGEEGDHEIRVGTRLAGDELQVEIANTGQAIPEAIQERIFEPFFTTKDAEQGTGLGLAISYAIVQQHKGRIEVDSRPDLTRFVIHLPLDNGLQARPTPGRRGGPSALAGKRILVVDDERAILDAMRRSLRGARVTTVSGGEEGLEALSREQDYHLVLCDLFMPGMSGMQFYEEVRRRYPRLAGRFVFMTGATFSERVRDFMAGVSARLLEKPIDDGELSSLLS